MNRFSSQRDLTARRNPSGGGTGDTRILWLCGCKAIRAPGAVVRGGLMLACAGCAKGKA